MMSFLQMKLQYSQCCNHITSVDIDPVFPAKTHQNIHKSIAVYDWTWQGHLYLVFCFARLY